MSDNNGVVKCQRNGKSGLKPGDYADDNSWCYSGTRDRDGYCVGKPLNDPCAIDLECDIGLYCNRTTKKCLEAGYIGDSCAKGEFCQSHFTCYEGKCALYGSIGLGQKVASSGSSKNCKTKYMDPATRICEHGPVLVSPMFSNASNMVCNYTYKGLKTTGYPMCGFSSNGSLICPKKEGDLEPHWIDLLNFTSYLPQCHVLHSYGFCDKAKKLGCEVYLRGSYAFYQIDPTTYALLQQVPVCLRNWVYTEYWYPECEKKSFAAGVVMGPLAILVLALVLIL